MRNDSTKQQIAGTLNNFIEKISNIAKTISSCLATLKNTFGSFLSSSSSNKAPPVPQKSLNEVLLEQKQKLNNQLKQLMEELKSNRENNIKKPSLLIRINSIKEQIASKNIQINNAKILTDSSNKTQNFAEELREKTHNHSYGRSNYE
ncbi:MAG: hypothetical protein JO131_04370 [Gammaproteobacteria bacterium]|nr:hypothetical protein [Gammaproteobacteria bacterium]